MTEKIEFKGRNHPRIKVKLKALLTREGIGEGNPRLGEIINFSRSGLFVISEEFFPIGAWIKIEIDIDKADNPLFLIGSVVSSKQGNAEKKNGMGIKIDIKKISEDDQQKLKSFFDLNHIYGWFC